MNEHGTPTPAHTCIHTQIHLPVQNIGVSYSFGEMSKQTNMKSAAVVRTSVLKLIDRLCDLILIDGNCVWHCAVEHLGPLGYRVNKLLLC